MKTPLLSLLVMILLASCARPYLDPNFATITATHETVAVLPFDIIFTGRYPKGLSNDDILQMENIERTDFQRSFYQSVLDGARRPKDALTIRLQDYRQTNRLLDQAGISIDMANTYAAQELATILKVDAVLRGTIEKERLMSDELSLGISVAAEILNRSTTSVLPGLVNLSKRVRASYDIVDAATGAPIWSLTSNDEANWQQSNIDIMNEINSGAAKRFPYRKRDQR